jgi:hypothetical protein
VDVAVPETGYEKLSAAIEVNGRSFAMSRGGRPDSDDAVILNKNVAVGEKLSRLGIDNRDVRDDKIMYGVGLREAP